jgi:ATP-dependent Clp protease ATP-binding subunit ClpA
VNDVDFSSLESDAPSMIAKFQKVKVEPADKDETVALLQDKLKALGHNNADTKVLERIIQLTNRFVPTRKQPGASMDVLDSALSYAELDGKDLHEDHVVKVVSDQAGVPKEFVGSSVSERIATLGDRLPKMVLGQDKAINKIIGSMKVANANLHDPDKPLGSFMLIGPTGVGKTETAKALAESLGVPLITEDMGNYQEQHAKAKLIGSPPGYVGFDKEAALEQVVKSPYCVLLLDEIEKAHGDVLNVLLSVLDEGRVQLMNGKEVDFKNCIILMTSNLGAKEAQDARETSSFGFGTGDDETEARDKAAEEVMNKAINNKLPPEFINRLDGILTYDTLKIEVARKIAVTKVAKVSEFLKDKNHNLHLELSDNAMEELVNLGYEPRYGARPMDRAIKDRLKEPLAEWLIENAKSITEPVKLIVKELDKQFNLEVKPIKAAGSGTPSSPPAPSPG